MDARPLRLTLTLFAWLFAISFATAGQYKTDNFVVTAPTDDLAKEVAMTAERWRARLAKEWLGYPLPKWYQPCPISVKVGQIGAGGATTFNFDRNPKTGQSEVFGWRMNVQGTRERILDSVIPHEVSHTIFASHFRRPLPRWADEGAATLAEHESEQRRQDLHLKQVWNHNRIPLESLLSMTEYPEDMQDVMTLYAEGYSLADYLVQKGGRRRYLKLLAVTEKEDWNTALKNLYGIESVSSLEQTWGDWVLAGSPTLDSDTLLASSEPVDRAGEGSSAEDHEVIRAQSDDTDPTPPQSVARPSEPIKTASLNDFQDFLRPAQQAAPSEKATSAAGAREPRPMPLGGMKREAMEARQRDFGATETSGRNDSASRKSLPRTSRVEPPKVRPLDQNFFNSEANERTGAPQRALGRESFPMASAP